MSSLPVEQHALTVIAKVEPARRDELVAALTQSKEAVCAAFRAVRTLHYARLVVFDYASGGCGLALESNFDGDEAAHLAELNARIGTQLDAFFGFCHGYTKGHFVEYATAHGLPPTTFYLGHPGLSVQQILHDRDVRDAIEKWLDAADAKGTLAKMGARDIVLELRAELARQGLAVDHVDRGFPPQPGTKLVFYAMSVGAIAVAVVAALVLGAFYEPADRSDEQKHPPELLPDGDAGVTALADLEDFSPQNGLTHIVPLKPGRFRRIVLRFVLWVVEQARRKLYYQGDLGGISTIHFARWVLLADGTLVFFSNYDGSWESYLGDFIDKAHIFLTGVWTNTKWFPETRLLIFGGASNATHFKRWARTFQKANQIWYSAYPDLSVTDIVGNAAIRELAASPMTDDEALQWLARL